MSANLNDIDSYLLREQLLHDERLVFESKMNLIYDETVIMLVQRLGAKITKDGDEYCCLYGDNIQEGICGFGKNPYLAALDFRKEFLARKEARNEKRGKIN